MRGSAQGRLQPIDIAGLPTGSKLRASDFQFKVGNSDNLSVWTAAPAPSVTVRDLGGGLRRVTLIWSDNAIQNEWLQVTVKATANTGLVTPDVFYFGNAIGETGNNTANAIVNLQDDLAARAHKSGFTPAGVTNVYDFNRDRRVNATDELIARYNHTTVDTALKLIDLTGGGQALGLTPMSVNSAGVEPTVAGSTVPLSVNGAVVNTASPLTLAEVPRTSPPTQAAASQNAAAHDIALAATVAQEPDRPKTWSPLWAWLCEYDQLTARDTAPKKEKLGSRVVDDLLAAYWG